MVARLSGCFRAIVTAGTVSRHTTMIERGVTEIFGIVAILALIVRLRMIAGFANGFYPIMAGRTCFRHAAVIKIRYRPLTCRMTAFALRLRADMVGRLSCCLHIVVAACTAFGGTLKNTAFVTGIASHFCMRTSQRKSGGEMIELFFGYSRRG